MSAPTSSFNKLSLSSKMAKPSSKKGEQSATNDPDPDISNSDDDGEPESGSEDEGETDLFAVHHCRKINDYYAFQMGFAKNVVNVSVRVTDKGVDCDSKECKEWLSGQLYGARGNLAVRSPYELISTLGIEKVCETLHWEHKATGDPPEDIVWELKRQRLNSELGLKTRGMALGRKRAVQYILDAMLVGDHRRDTYPEKITLGNMFVPHDIEATLCRMLLCDDQLFYQFSGVISRNERFTFYKFRAQAKTAFVLFDQHMESGPTGGQTLYDVSWCTEALSNIVDDISSATLSRQDRSAREDAAQCLVYILQEVVKRNALYHRLIGSPRQTSAHGNFVIGALQGLRDVAEGSADDLEEILDAMKQPRLGAPAGYADELKVLVKQLKSGHASGAAGKRPGGQLEKGKGKKPMK